MSPIRVAFIGLSKTAVTSWASAAHLPYIQAHPEKYQITALCNSSKESAQRSIQDHELPSSTKAYGNPEDLAQDPDVDLVICATRVDNHYPTIKPSILAGKDVFVEWPLSSTLEQSLEIHSLTKEREVRTMISLQGRRSPIVIKLKELLTSNTIGSLLSSSISAVSGFGGSSTMSQGLAYFLSRSVGGNGITIAYAHMIDMIHHVLGEFSSFQAHGAIIQKEVDIVDASGKTLKSVQPDVPDFLTIHGTLEGSNAPLGIVWRRRQPFKDTPGFVWDITGDKGEIRVTSPKPAFNVYDEGTEIWVEDYESREVKKVEWKSDYEHLNSSARNIAGLYEAYARGEGYPDFEIAVRRMKEIEELFKSVEEGRVAKYV